MNVQFNYVNQTRGMHFNRSKSREVWLEIRIIFIYRSRSPAKSSTDDRRVVAKLQLTQRLANISPYNLQKPSQSLCHPREFYYHNPNWLYCMNSELQPQLVLLCIIWSNYRDYKWNIRPTRCRGKFWRIFYHLLNRTNINERVRWGILKCFSNCEIITLLSQRWKWNRQSY